MKKYFNQFTLTLKYCKTEFISGLVWLGVALFSFILAFFSVFYLKLNDFQLPMNFIIPFLSFEEIFSLNWYLNYFFQCLGVIYLAIFYFPFIVLILILINHACWGIDVLILLVKNLGEKIDYKIPADSLLRKDIIAKEVKAIVEMTVQAQEWRNKVQSLLAIIFLVDFSVLSFMFCLCIYNISSSVFESFVIPAILNIILNQLYVYCWMGSRVISRIDNLTIAIYDINWHLLDAKQRKDILKILPMAQNMQGFNGIFHSVSLDTFQKVLLIDL